MRLVRIPKLTALALVTVAVLVIATWNIRLYIDDALPLDRSSDYNTLIANTFAYQLLSLGPGYTPSERDATEIYA